MSAGDQQFMARTLELAARGRGKVEPNPMVGCLIVKDGRLIGEGYHQRFGRPHAEREALANCTQPPQGAALYVNLEPCCHTSKKTPPCVPALIQAKVGRVVIGCEDPNPQVSGQGAAMLRQAGIHVEIGQMEAEAKQLNAPFFARVKLGRPYITLKWAQSADGKVALSGGQRRQISGEPSMRLVHLLRARSDAILVGINTVLSDDPLLTARGIPDPRPLIRAVLDRRLRIPLESKLVQTARESPVVIYHEQADPSKAQALQSRGVEVIAVAALSDVLADLHRRQVTHLLVEGGPTIARSFMRENLADRVWVFQSPLQINQADAPEGPAIVFPSIAQCQAGEDRLTEYLNPRSDAFFAPIPSCDFPNAPAADR